jgi:hypothetical protein
MSTLDAKTVRKKNLNPKLLAIAAVLLILLALSFLATPLLGMNSGFQRDGNLPNQFNGQSLPGGENGFPAPGNIPPGQGFPGQGGSNIPGRQFGAGGARMGVGLLAGMGGTIVYAIALLISLIAALGMFMVKRWGQVLGIIMAVFYGLLALVSLLPILLFSVMGMRNPLNLILSIVNLLLPVAVVVLASIPGKELAVHGTPLAPPAAPTQA